MRYGKSPCLGEQGQVPAPRLPCWVSSVRSTDLHGVHRGECRTPQCRGEFTPGQAVLAPSQAGFLYPCAGSRLGTTCGHCQLTGTCTHPTLCQPKFKICSEKKCKACHPLNEKTRVPSSSRIEGPWSRKQWVLLQLHVHLGFPRF